MRMDAEHNVSSDGREAHAEAANLESSRVISASPFRATVRLEQAEQVRVDESSDEEDDFARETLSKH
jgi:hypothetical protein